MRDAREIRRAGPLIHNITNYVAMNFTANALLAVGASPVMAHACGEAAEMASLASALVINIGTLSPDWVCAMEKARDAAARKKIPVLLDPVGAGATAYRTETAAGLLARGVTAVRANGSETMALAGAYVRTKGVDSTAPSRGALEAAVSLLGRGAAVAVVSGETDYIAGSGGIVAIKNGHPVMARVTAMGCAASAIAGAFMAVNGDPAQACAHAMAVMGMAGEIAAENSRGPGSFQAAFLDALHSIGEKDMERLRVEEKTGFAALPCN